MIWLSMPLCVRVVIGCSPLFLSQCQIWGVKAVSYVTISSFVIQPLVAPLHHVIPKTHP
jgi:hypothetical protein